MKLIYFGVNSHHKNSAAIRRMCDSLKIEFEDSQDYSRLSRSDYHIVIFHSFYVDPEEASIPQHVKVIYGPQHWVIPTGKLTEKLDERLAKRCVFNILSKWVGVYVAEFTDSFAVPLVPFPFSVDTEKFKPIKTTKTTTCLVYIKRRDNLLIKYVLDRLNDCGMSYKIFTYGSYQESEYLESLQSCNFMISLDAHESQGFALEEAMSCNVPLLVVDAQSMYDEKTDGVNSVFEYLRPRKLLATSVPYWSDKCGVKISTSAEFSDALDLMMKTWNMFSPREYILETLSDEVCMKRILNYFNMYTDNLVLVTSVINIPMNLPLSYTNTRSVYNSVERFEQTKKTIESIRKRIPDSKIFFTECSSISNEQETYLRDNCDYFINFYDSPDVVEKAFTKSKALGEGTLTIKSIESILKLGLKFKNFFKISGRYIVSDKFNYENFTDNYTVVKYIDGNQYNIVTSLFKIPFEWIEPFLNFLKSSTCDMVNCIGYEVLFAKFVHKFDLIRHIDPIGVQGNIGVDGYFYDG